MQEHLEKLKTKIAKMLALAESEAKTGNEEAAARYMEMISELLEKHQIGLHEIRRHSERIIDPLGHEKGTNHIPSSLAWFRLASVAIAKYYGCRFIFTADKKQVHYTLVGAESSRVTTELMIPFIISQVRQTSRKYLREMLAQGYTNLTEVKAQTHVGLALIDRIWALIRANDMHRLDLVGKGLIPVDETNQYVENVWGDLKSGKRSTGRTTGLAREHAEKISLHVQMTTDRRRMISSK